MKQISDKQLRRTVVAWWKAHIRWMEYTMAEVGTEEYRRLNQERQERHEAKVATEVNLLRIGNDLALAGWGKTRKAAK
jgi:hypothetical protein